MIFRMILAMLFLASSMHAEVVRIEVKSRADLIPGKTFGSAGAYEKLAGRIYFAVDLNNSANRLVTDIDKAPRNSSGKVEFSSDFYLIKPKELGRGNGTILYEVSNRGGKGMLGRPWERDVDHHRLLHSISPHARRTRTDERSASFN